GPHAHLRLRWPRRPDQVAGTEPREQRPRREWQRDALEAPRERERVARLATVAPRDAHRRRVLDARQQAAPSERVPGHRRVGPLADREHGIAADDGVAGDLDAAVLSEAEARAHVAHVAI